MESPLCGAFSCRIRVKPTIDLRRKTGMPRIMTGSGRVFLALLLLTSVFNGTALAVHGGGSREIMIGDTFESRTLETIEGKSLKIPSGDELTVVLFWATWSPRSKPALDLWQKFEQDYSGQSVKIITINSEHQGLEPGQRQEIIRYVENNGITLPVVRNPTIRRCSPSSFCCLRARSPTYASGRWASSVRSTNVSVGAVTFSLRNSFTALSSRRQ